LKKVRENKKNNIPSKWDRYFTKRKQLIENRAILRPIIETILLCERKNIALRRNYYDSGKIYDEIIQTNYGNFRSLLRFESTTDSILDNNLKNATFFATYTSSSVQNEIIKIGGDLIQENILTKIKNSKFFSVLVDETQDISRLERL